MDRRDFLLTGTLAAAATAATTASSRQVLAQTRIEAEPGVNMDRPNIAYEGGKVTRKLEIVNLLDLEPEAQIDATSCCLRHSPPRPPPP